MKKYDLFPCTADIQAIVSTHLRSTLMKQVDNRHLTDVWAVLVQGHGRIIAPDFCVAHREANSGLSTLNRTKSILSIYHQQRQLQKQRGMCLNDTYPFCQQPLSGNCHSICFSKPVLWAATPRGSFFMPGISGFCLLIPFLVRHL